LRAIVPDLANRPRQLVFLTAIDSKLNDFLNEIHQIARMEPSIVERIDEDLDLHAKKKKPLRLIDEQFLAKFCFLEEKCQAHNLKVEGSNPSPATNV
jgi:hypothetical protein